MGWEPSSLLVRDCWSVVSVKRNCISFMVSGDERRAESCEVETMARRAVSQRGVAHKAQDLTLSDQELTTKIPHSCTG